MPILHAVVTIDLYDRLALAAAAQDVSIPEAARRALLAGLIRQAELDEVPAVIGGATKAEIERIMAGLPL